MICWAEEGSNLFRIPIFLNLYLFVYYLSLTARLSIILQTIKVKKCHMQENIARLVLHLYNFHIHYIHFHKNYVRWASQELIHLLCKWRKRITKRGSDLFKDIELVRCETSCRSHAMPPLYVKRNIRLEHFLACRDKRLPCRRLACTSLWLPGCLCN